MSKDDNTVDLTTVDLRKVAFSSEIRRIATTIDREPTAEQTTALESILQQAAVLEDGKIAIITSDGTAPVVDFIAKSLSRLPPMSVAADEAPPAVTHPIEPYHARGRTDLFGQLSRGFAAAEQAASLKEAVKGPNPWSKGHENRTRAQIIANLNPALAAELKLKAGVN